MKKLVSCILVMVMVVVGMAAYACEQYTVMTTGTVNVRENPDIDSDVIGTIESGVEIFPCDWISTSDGRVWLQLDWNGEDGYVSEKYVEYLEPEYYVEVYNSPVQMITTGDVFVRCWASIEGPIYETLEKGTQIDVWGFYPADDGRIWCEIEIDDGYYDYGYVSMKYAEFVEEWPELGQYMQVTGGRVNVRETASIDADDIGTLTRGTIVEAYYYLPTSDGRIWAMCLDENGEDIGFVSVKYLQKVSAPTETVAE